MDIFLPILPLPLPLSSPEGTRGFSASLDSHRPWGIPCVLRIILVITAMRMLLYIDVRLFSVIKCFYNLLLFLILTVSEGPGHCRCCPCHSRGTVWLESQGG